MTPVAQRNALRSWNVFILPVLLIILFSIVNLLSCGTGDGGDDTAEKNARYDGWQQYTQGRFTAHISPVSPFFTEKERLVSGYNEYLNEICSLLELPPPEDAIHVYVYTTPQEMKTVAGRSASFVNGNSIHWDGRSPYGDALTRLVLAHNNIQPGDFQVIYEGIANLLDFSGINYHAEMANLAETEWFIPLATLGDDSVFNAAPAPVQRMESASLAGFIVSNYGSQQLLVLARSEGQWQETLETLFQMKMDAIERSWLEFARTRGQDPEEIGAEEAP